MKTLTLMLLVFKNSDTLLFFLDTSSESNDTYNLSAIFEDEQMYSTKEEEEETSEIVDSESNNYY